MSAPIYQCEEGHSICCTCKDNRRKCPVCKKDVTTRRNFVVEGVSDLLMHPCPYAKRGCSVRMRPSDLEEHKTLCECNTHRKCPFCAISSADYSICSTFDNSLIRHLFSAHEEKFLSVNTKHVFDQENFPRDVWKIVNFFYCGESIFYLNSCRRNGNVICAVQRVGTRSEAKNYVFYFCLSSKANHRSAQFKEVCTGDFLKPGLIIRSCFYISVVEKVALSYKEPMFSVSIKKRN